MDINLCQYTTDKKIEIEKVWSSCSQALKNKVSGYFNSLEMIG